MEIHPIDVYSSPNIGVFLNAAENLLLAPRGLTPTKIERISSLLQVRAVETAVGSSRLLGPLIAMNSNGIVVSRMMEEQEISLLAQDTGLMVVRLPGKYTAVGNLIAVNDNGALVSSLLPKDCIDAVRKTLDVHVEPMAIASYSQIGVMIAPTNGGAIIHPAASEREIDQVSSILNVKVTVATVNKGVPFVSSGIVANSKSLIVGSLTSGPELAMLSQAFE